MQEEDIAGGEVQNSREVRKVAGPIHPGRKKSCAFTEGFFSPDIETAFGGKAGRKRDNRNRQWEVKEEPRAEPDDQGRRTVTRGGGDPAEADTGDDVEEEKVAEAHDARGSDRRIHDGRG